MKVEEAKPIVLGFVCLIHPLSLYLVELVCKTDGQEYQ